VRRKFLIAAAALCLPAACVAPNIPPTAAPDGGPGVGPCPVRSAGNWRAWIDLMPGAKRTLNVVGQVTAPSGGYRVWIERGGLLEIHPPVQQMILRTEPPSGPATAALVTHDVQASFPSSDTPGSVVVLCGGATLAVISPVGAAH